MSATYSGSCLCGKVTFQASQFEERIAHCHCTMCQKFHGAAFSTFAEVKLKNFKFTAGQALLSSYVAENKSERQFCKHCGASLIFISQYNRQDETIEVALPTFDNIPDNINIDAHIFCNSKGKWLQLNDSIEKFDQYRK